jgi:hypothetical protein
MSLRPRNAASPLAGHQPQRLAGTADRRPTGGGTLELKTPGKGHWAVLVLAMRIILPDVKGVPMMNKVLSLLILVVVFSCPFAGYLSTARGEPVRIIFDTDMGSDCDDAGALAVLHVYADRGLAEIIGCIYSSGKVPYGAGVVEAINVYYGRPEIPIGAAHDDEVGDPIDKMTAEKLAKDTAAFGNTIIHSRDAEEMTALNRRLLAQEEDNSVVYLTVGHTKGFYDLLVSKPDDISPLSGRELVREEGQTMGRHGGGGRRQQGGTLPEGVELSFQRKRAVHEVPGGKLPRADRLHRYGQRRIHRQIVEDHSAGEHRSDGLPGLALERGEEDPRRPAAQLGPDRGALRGQRTRGISGG